MTLSAQNPKVASKLLRKNPSFALLAVVIMDGMKTGRSGWSTIQPRRLMRNGHVESFHSRLRDECLNATWFRTLNDVRCILAARREKYNCERPHNSLDYRHAQRVPHRTRTERGHGPLSSQTIAIKPTEKTLIMNE